jgi:diacylglycerol kinase
VKKLFRSFLYAFSGLRYALKTQRNMRIHFLALFLAVLLGIWVKLIRFEWAILFLCCGSVIAAEIFNTSLEKLMDHLHPEKNEAIRRAKDLAAAAVLVLALFSLLVGYFLFWEKLKHSLGIRS